jgi:hypothetical protein
VGGVGSSAGVGDEDELEPEGEERLNGGPLSPGLSRREDIVALYRSRARWRYGESTARVQGSSGVAEGVRPGPGSLWTAEQEGSTQEIGRVV